ncbi:hypothetical protein H0H92_000544 [Tricholoma furcatifolium]|nr:hypothetical protein H0H92_000544 [Tricholoma furcatifolium]
MSSKKSKKQRQQRPQITHNVDAKQRAQEEAEHEAAVGRLLRSSSTRYTVVSEVEYSSLPPLPHPINDVLQTVNPNAIRTRGSSTTSIASSTISQRGTYNVTVHKRTQHKSTASQDGATKFESIRESKENSSHLLELRSHPSVASLLDVYDEHGRIPEQAFSNSPPPRERAQTRRSGSTLRQLLGQPPSMSSRKSCEDGAYSAEGDISWAERFLGEADSVSSPESSIELQTPSTLNAHNFENQNNKVHDPSFTSDHDLSMITHENPAISSMAVELSVDDSTTSIKTKSSTTAHKISEPAITQRASQVFQFLTERRRSTSNPDQERPSSGLPSAFGVSSEGSLRRSLDGRSHFEDSLDAMAPIHSAIPVLSQANPLSKSKLTPNAYIPSSETEENTSHIDTSPTNAVETVWVASDARRRTALVNAPSMVIITAPTPSRKSGTPSRIPRGPRSPYRKTSSISGKARRSSTLAERSMNSPASHLKSKNDHFTPAPVKHQHRRPSDASSPSTCSQTIEISPPTRLSRKSSSIGYEVDKENGAELSVKSTLPSTPLRSKSDSRSLFRTAVTPAVFRPPPDTIPSPASSSELSPVGKKLMMDVRKQRSKARSSELQNRNSELAKYHDTAPYRSQTSHATYLLSGEIDPPYAEDVPMDYEEGKDVLGDYEDDGDEVPQTKLLLVNEDDLEGYICTPTDHVRTADRGKDATEMVKIVGKVVSSNIKIVHTAPKPAKYTRQPVAGPSKLKPAADKEKEASVEPTKETVKAADKVKDKVKASGKLNFFNTKPKEKKTDVSADTSKGKEKEAVQKLKEEEKEEVVEKPKKKEKEEEKEKPKDTAQEEAKPSKAQQSKIAEPKKRGTKRKSALGLSDSEEERRPSKAPSRHVSPLPPPKEKAAVRVKGRAVISDDEDDEAVHTSRKSRKARPTAALDPDNADVLALMDIDDDEVTRVTREKRVPVEAEGREEKTDEEMEEKPIVGDDEDIEMEDAVPKAKPKKRAPKKVVPVGRNGLKKKRVVKSRTKIDDKGYMVTEDYSEYESVDEEPQAEPARGKGKAKTKEKEQEQESDDDSSTAAAAKAKPIAKGAPPKAPAKAPAKGGNKGGSRFEEPEEFEDKTFELGVMVQTYGVVPANPAEPGDGRDSSEQSALLGGGRDTSVKRVAKPDGHASLFSCISNLANTIMGTGMLTFPLAMASAGLIPGIITCVFSGCVGAFGLYLLTLCATYTPHRRSSFFSVAQLTFPKAAVFFDAAIAIKCFGVSISYLIIVKGLMPNVVQSFYHVLTPPEKYPPAWMLNGSNWITIFMALLGPLAFLRHLDSLRHTSYIALFAVGTPAPGEVNLIKFTPNFVSTFPVQVFAFTCAQNIFPLYNEIKSNTQDRMNMVIGGSIGSAIIVYEIIAVFGYLTFGSKVGANIVAMYPSVSLFIAVGQLAIVVLVLFSYALQVHPCRNCLDKVLRAGRPAETKVAVPGEGEDVVDEDHAETEMSPLRHGVLTTGIIAAGFTVAYLVDNLQMGKW